MKMAVILFLLGLLFIALGTGLILSTNEVKQFFKNFLAEKNLKIAAAAPGVVGFLFIVGAGASTHPLLLRILGILCLAEAAMMVFNPKGLYTEMLNWYFEKISERTHQIFGIVAVIVGTFIVAWVW
jgi:hypothetical protein